MAGPDARPETYTHGHHESVLRSHRSRTVENSAAYLIGRLHPGVDVLDVGCGPGTITVDLAARVAPGRGRRARQRSRASSTRARADDAARSPNATFQTGDVYALDFPDASFDVVHAHQVLQHLTDPVAALREMRRVCKPDGVVGVPRLRLRGHDLVPGDPRTRPLARRCTTTSRASNGAEADAGRRLRAWALAGRLLRRAPLGVGVVLLHARGAGLVGWHLGRARASPPDFGEQAVERGLATRRRARTRSRTAGEAWTAADDGWFAVLHGEMLGTP